MTKKPVRKRNLRIRKLFVNVMYCAMTILVLSFSLFLVWSHIQIVNIGYGISEANKEKKELLQLNNELRLEIATLKSPHYIENIAKKKLGLRFPKPCQVVIIK